MWLDEQLPAHRAYGDVIAEHLTAANAVVVIWSAEAARSEWVRSEANAGREARKLVQLSVDGAKLPMPFDQIQCADLTDWNGDLKAAGWRKVADSIAELIGGGDTSAPPATDAPLPLPSKPSIAILPFKNMSKDPDQEFFADGLVEAITATLSRIRSFFVIARNSAFRYKGKAVNLVDVGRELGVRYILEGSVQRAGDRLRITVQLVDAVGDAHIWADHFDGTLGGPVRPAGPHCRAGRRGVAAIDPSCRNRARTTQAAAGPRRVRLRHARDASGLVAGDGRQRASADTARASAGD